jgi:energy-coupling factor transporter ATP-binding protein EcfA2
MIRVELFSYSYPDARSPALQEIDLHVPVGQFCGIVGPNGAGKSTLCYALTGFIPHHYRGKAVGRVVVAGRDIAETTLSELAGDVGLVFQNPFNQITWARFTIREEVAFGLENLGVSRPEMEQRVDEALALTGLTELASRSPHTLSGGEQQRLALASMMVMRPRLLVLDEPTSQLDPVGTMEVFAAVRNLAASGNVTVVLVEHKLEWLATFADRIVAMTKGRIVADGTPSEVLTNREIEEHGIIPTRYTQAVWLAEAQGYLVPTKAIPVTLKQAQEHFR